MVPADKKTSTHTSRDSPYKPSIHCFGHPKTVQNQVWTEKSVWLIYRHTFQDQLVEPNFAALVLELESKRNINIIYGMVSTARTVVNSA